MSSWIFLKSNHAFIYCLSSNPSSQMGHVESISMQVNFILGQDKESSHKVQGWFVGLNLITMQIAQWPCLFFLYILKVFLRKKCLF